jgi:hypothetical protein
VIWCDGAIKTIEIYNKYDFKAYGFKISDCEKYFSYDCNMDVYLVEGDGVTIAGEIMTIENRMYDLDNGIMEYYIEYSM